MIVQRFVDAWLSFPDLVILIVVVAVVGPGMPQVIGILGVQGGIGGSRIIRSAVLSVREQSYVHAAQSIGGTSSRVMLRHILPNVMAPVIVLFTTRRRQRHPRRIRAVVPRPRRSAARADLGRHADRLRRATTCISRPGWRWRPASA